MTVQILFTPQFFVYLDGFEKNIQFEIRLLGCFTRLESLWITLKALQITPEKKLKLNFQEKKCIPSKAECTHSFYAKLASNPVHFLFSSPGCL